MDVTLQRVKPAQQRADQVHVALVEAIAQGTLEPGTRLRVDHLAKWLGVSITPVRDALNRLEEQGLVTRTPYQGASVRSFTADEIRDLYEVRLALESLAVDIVCRSPDPVLIGTIRRLQYDGAEAFDRGDVAAYHRSNRAFHDGILKGSGNGLLVRLMDAISLQIQMTTALNLKVPARPAKAILEHAELVALLEKGDAEGAKRLLDSHIREALAYILSDAGVDPAAGGGTDPADAEAGRRGEGPAG